MRIIEYTANLFFISLAMGAVTHALSIHLLKSETQRLMAMSMLVFLLYYKTGCWDILIVILPLIAMIVSAVTTYGIDLWLHKFPKKLIVGPLAVTSIIIISYPIGALLFKILDQNVKGTSKISLFHTTTLTIFRVISHVIDFNNTKNTTPYTAAKVMLWTLFYFLIIGVTWTMAWMH